MAREWRRKKERPITGSPVLDFILAFGVELGFALLLGGGIAGGAYYKCNNDHESIQSQVIRSEVTESRVREIAEKAFVERFGSQVLAQRPFSVVLVGQVWRVSGTLPCPPGGNCRGGVAEAEVSANGDVLTITHGK